MHRYGLIGYPLGHSFSKDHFTSKFNKEGLADHIYELFPVPSVTEIKDIIRQHPDLLGLNVTIPYKQTVLNYLDDVTNIPAGLQACNCIKISGGKLYGYNTDVTGFERSLIPQLSGFQDKALVLGNGGAAEAVKYVLAKNNMGYKIVSRELHADSHLTYKDVDAAVMAEYRVIINTTPLGMYPLTQACPDIPYGLAGKDHYFFDLIYNPAKTVFLQKAEAAGAAIQNGYNMLVIQAEESWKIWSGTG